MDTIINKYNHFNSKHVWTPHDPSLKLFKNTGDDGRQIEYANIIHSLRYAAGCNRSNMVYVLGLLWRFTSRSSNEHWQVIELVMKYLKRVMNLNLHYQCFLVVLEGYNKEYQNNLSNDSNATIGYIFNIIG